MLTLVSNALGGLNDENFDSVMSELNANFHKMNIMRDDLKGKYDKNTLRLYQPQLDAVTKQLENKFDNIVKEIKTEQEQIAQQLKNIQIKKKLTNYNR